MLTSEFDYHLPEELIASEPLADRAASRMLVVDRGRQSISIIFFATCLRSCERAIWWC